MTGPKHYREAEALLVTVGVRRRLGDTVDPSTLAEAQVHATLAQAAATALGSDLGCWDAWRQVAGTPEDGAAVTP